LNDSTLHDALIQSAHEAFLGLEALYKALYPLDPKGKTYHVTRINPEAGNHPIPDDEREINATIQASDRGWNFFPYYEQRYGKRGKRFSDSDTCWLVTLARLDQANLQKQVEWLGRVLVTRGMPLIMLEQTLRFLHEELVKAVPENTLTYEKLLKSADFIKAAREAAIPEAQLEALAEEFNQAVSPEMAERFRNAGQLLVSSVADERNGIEGAVAALQEWMTDENRFPQEWIAAVNHIIDKASKL